MNDFDYSDLRNIFEKYTDWAVLQQAKNNEEDYREEYLMTLDNAAKFSLKELAPLAEEVDQEGCKLKTGEDGKAYVQMPQGTLKNIDGLKEIGAFCGLTFPESAGGYDFPMSVFFGIGELLSMGDSSLGLTPMLQEGVGQVLLEFANSKILDSYLPKLISGDRICSMGLTEADAGSDLANMKTTARPVNEKDNEKIANLDELKELGEVYILNGSKIFITNGFGDVLALARTGESISMFLVNQEDKDVSRVEKKLGIRGSATCELLFEESPGVLIGELGDGLVPNMLKLMYIARLGVSCQGLGIAQRAHLMAKNYATNDRVQFGVPIAEHGPVRQILFENEIELQASRALTYLASYYFDLKEALQLRIKHMQEDEPSYSELRNKLMKYTRITDLLIPMVKYDTAELCNRITYSSLQIFGGYGFTQEYPVERLYRDARITSIYEGTSQIQLREVFNGAYYLEKIGILNQFKLGHKEGFVETEKNRAFIDHFLDGLKEEILSVKGGASTISDLLSGVDRIRECLKRSRQALFLQEQQLSKELGRKFHALFYQEYTDLLGHIFKGYLLIKQSLSSPHKEKVARAYIERAVLSSNYSREKIERGLGDIISDDYYEIMNLE